MKTPVTIAFFNNKGGVGKTTLVYHLAWMLQELGTRVLAVDFDPQANLSSMFLDEDELIKLWPADGEHKSVLSCITPISEGLGDITEAPLQDIADDIYLLAGDLGLSQFEDKLSDGWPRCLDNDKAAFRAITAFYRIMVQAAESCDAKVILMDVGPNLGAINRSALIGAEHVVMPLAPGLFSLQGLRNLGPTLRAWRDSWQQRLDRRPSGLDIPMPTGRMRPTGYVVMQHVERRNRPVKAYQRWVEKIPEVYRRYVLDESASVADTEADPNQIGLIKNYQSLMPMAQDARKPIFKLQPVDGAIGAHAEAVRKCYLDFKNLTQVLMECTSSETPGSSGAGPSAPTS